MVFDKASGWLSNLVPESLRNALTDEHRATVERFLTEAVAAAGNDWKGVKIDTVATGREILGSDERNRVQIALAAIAALASLMQARTWSMCEFVRKGCLVRLITQLLRGLKPSESELMDLIRASAASRACFFTACRGGAGLLGIVEDHAREYGMTAGVARELSSLAAALFSRHGPSAEKLIDRVERLASGTPEEPLKSSAWAQGIEAWLASLDPAQSVKWKALFAHAAVATSEPSQRWAKEAAQRSGEIGAADVGKRILEWIEPFEPDPAHPEPNADLLKGLIWCLGVLAPEPAAFALTTFAERCFKKVPNIGARSVKLGNACLHALALLPDGGGVAALSRLKGKIRYPSAAKQIDAALLAVAERSGRSVEDVEELALPTFGLNASGVVVHSIGDFAAEIAIAGTDSVETRWRGSGGRSQRSVPASLQQAAPDRVREVKRIGKEIESALSGQVRRLEGTFLHRRSWPISEWRQRYLRHPLLRGLTQRLIWSFEADGRVLTALPEGEHLVNAAGEPADPGGNEALIRLWHPIAAPADEVLRWRRRLEALGVVQPFKQAHREIYVLTDAERQTDVYSNRFAGHVLRQHQLRSLCQQRGWAYRLQGNFDSHNVPTRRLDWLDMSVEFWVEAVPEDRSAAIHAHVTTDQVRFVANGGELVPLATVDPVVFSELMRDVDLFVSVTSVGNDPNWADGGPRPFAGYWREYAFGELSATAQTRRDVLQALLPRLKIADRCTLTDRSLVVRGEYRTYKIHLGSANIMMEPNDQYLCIVPDRSAAARRQSKVYLPFEGDATLSVILSKAFLLADDRSITDPQILRQIRP